MYKVYSSELYHHGILGMKWGVRRYQPYPKGHKGGKEIGEAATTQKATRKNKKNKEEQVIDKDTALRAGNAKQVLKYQGELSNKELIDALNRIKWENELTKLSAPNNGWERMNYAMSKVQDVNNWYNTASTAVRNGRTIYNGTKNVVNNIRVYRGR